MKKVLGSLVLFLTFAIAALPSFASAHEVYVLHHDEVERAMEMPRPDYLGVIQDNLGEFLKWGAIVLVMVLAVLYLSLNTSIEKGLDPFLLKVRKYAPHITQITLGLALLVSGYYRGIFGVEISLDQIFGSYATLASGVLIVLGLMLVLGIYPRLAALITLFVFVGFMFKYGIYMLNYLTYLAEAITVALFGGAYAFVADIKLKAVMARIIRPKYNEYKFLVFRVLFGFSLIFASLYAKFFYGALALSVVEKYNLMNYFPFDPIFLVLGAMIIEIMLGVFFIIGFEVRFASIFLLIFLSLSINFFGEAVWPHIILIGTALAMLVHGYDQYTLTKYLSKKLGQKRKMEPTF